MTHAEAVLRAAEIALEEHEGRFRPGTARAYVEALPDDFRPEGWAAITYTLARGYWPPIIRQAMRDRRKATKAA